MPSRIRGWNSPRGTPVSRGHWLESSRSGGRFLSGECSQKRFLFAWPAEMDFLKQLGLETECEHPRASEFRTELTMVSIILLCPIH